MPPRDELPPLQRRAAPSRFSLRSTPSSMITNRNRTTIAPAYTMICATKRNSAPRVRNSTATESRFVTSSSAACTALRWTIIATAEPSAIAPKMTKSVIALDRGRRHAASPGAAREVVRLAPPLLRQPHDGNVDVRRVRVAGGRVVQTSDAGLLHLALRQDDRVADVAELRPLDVGRRREELLLRVDHRAPRLARELEEGRHGDRVRRARLDAQPAEDAPEHVDLVDGGVPLAGRDRVLRVVLGPPHEDRVGRTRARAQLAADALLQAVVVAVEDVPSVHARRRLLRSNGNSTVSYGRTSMCLSVTHMPFASATSASKTGCGSGFERAGSSASEPPSV